MKIHNYIQKGLYLMRKKLSIISEKMRLKAFFTLSNKLVTC